MAKGQKRSNREAKKPKQDKSKTPAVAVSSVSNLTDKQERKPGAKK